MENFKDLVVLIPTTGSSLKLNNSLRSLNAAAIVNQVQLHIVISLNSATKSISDLQLNDFANLRIRMQSLNDFVDSAEESTLMALKNLKPNLSNDSYVWILGDDDFILPFGLGELLKMIKTGNYEVIFTNSHQVETKGKNLQGPFIHSYENFVKKDFVNFALKCGINYSPTGFGRLIIKSTTIRNLEFWTTLIESGGPIFSYVTYFMYALKNRPMIYLNTPLIIYRQNDYHEGNHIMWTKYAERRKTLEFAPWTIELVRQLKVLIEHDVVTIRDLALSTIIEREIGYRFPVLILEQFHEQIRVALRDKRQFPEANFVDEVGEFLCLIAPDVAPTVEQIEKLYSEMKSRKLNSRKLVQEWQRIREIIVSLRLNSPYQGLIVDYHKGHIIGAHLDGFIATNKHTDLFKFAYRILDPSNQNFVLFSEDLIQLKLDIDEKMVKSEHPYPKNIFDSSYIVKTYTKQYSENTQYFISKLFVVWERIPRFARSILKRFILRGKN